LGIALLAGLGVQAWSEARTPLERAFMLVPAVLVFGVLPPLNHVTHGHSGLVAAMAVVAVAVLALTAWRPGLLALVPAVLAVELVANGFVGQGVGSTPSGVGVAGAARYVAWAPLREPGVDAASYVHPTAIARRLQRA